MEQHNCLRCAYRHEDNGNCTAVGGFCTAVPAAHCRLLQEYLGTGLTPDGVEALKLSMMGKAVAEIKEFDGLLNPKTNADCIRAMSDEELAEFLDTTQKMECEAFHVINSDGTLKFESLKNGWLKWLQQPAEGWSDGTTNAKD